MKRNLILLFLLFICQYSIAQHPEYGLHIQSYPMQSSEYTSMALENGEAIETKGENITLTFNLWVRNDNVFGAVFRIITNNNKNVDLMYSVSENDKRFPILVAGDAVHPISKEVRREIWVPISLTIQPKEGEIIVEYDSTKVQAKYPELKGIQSLRIAFGYCPFDGFSLADVASVNLKDVSLRRGMQEIRSWKMARHNGDNCYDDNAHVPAVGKNTRWIIDQYITWKPLHFQKFATSPSIAFDPTVGTFYMATDKSKLYIYHTEEQVMDTIRVKGGEFVANYPNQLIYVPQRHQLLSYNLDENLYSAFDPYEHTWTGTQAPVKEHDYWNNTIVYNPANESLISFGGYGHYHFNNELLICYPWSENTPQRRISLTTIHPRHSLTSALVDSTLYIFGGRGSPTGRQELSPRNYYDLYAVNLLTQQANKVWENSEISIKGDFKLGENMIYDSNKDCFYFFSNQEGGTLMKIDRQAPRLESMSLPIGLNLSMQYTYSNLYYSQKQQKLYAAIHQADASGKAELHIYELNFPPISVEAFKQSVTGIDDNAGYASRYIWFCLAGVILLLGIGGWFYYKKKRKEHSVRQTKELDLEKEANIVAKSESITGINFEMPVSSAEPVSHNYDFSQKCVCFFGGFRVIDKEGNDITYLFTPTLKTLLILLVLYTGKDPKGIIGHKLIQVLWYDKSDESAKNNRNVYMSKLRSLLEKVGDIKIINQSGFWSIQFEEGTVCDYQEALHLYRETNSQSLEKLLELLLRGVMLPNMEIDWIDKFKNEFSNTTIDLLSKLLKREDLSDTLKLKIADTLFQHDYINEEALCVKCRILCQQGKKGLAKTVYDTFCKEYNLSMGTDYRYSLMEVIERTS